jgi:hypothetical protein
MRTPRRLLSLAAVAVTIAGTALVAGPGAAVAADTVSCASSAQVLGVDSAGGLYAYPLRSPATSSASITSKTRIGSGWSMYGKVLAGGSGWVYGLKADGLYLYHRTSAGTWDVQRRHFGFLGQYAVSSRSNRITVDQRGTIYVLTDAGAVTAYRFDATRESLVAVGDVVLEADSTRNLIVASGDGVLYLRHTNGTLDRVRYEATSDRIITGPTRVGSGWGGFNRLSAVGGDVLLATTPGGELATYRYREDTRTWPVQRHKVGAGWQTIRQLGGQTDACRLTVSYVPPVAAPPAGTSHAPGVNATQGSTMVDAVTPDAPNGGLVWARIDASTGGKQEDDLLFSGQPVGTPSVSRLTDDRMSVLAPTRSGTMYGAVQVPGRFGLKPATDEGGRMSTSPVSATIGTTTYHFAIDSNGKLWVKPQLRTTGQFLPWQQTGVSGLLPLSVWAQPREGAIALAVVTTDGELRLGSFEGNWAIGWLTLSRGVFSQPAIFAYPGWDKVSIAFRGEDQRLHARLLTLSDATATGERVFGEAGGGYPTIGVRGDGRSFVLTKDESGDPVGAFDSAPFKADWSTMQSWGGTATVSQGSNPVAVTGYSWGAGSTSTMELQAATSQNGSHRTIVQLTRP